MFSVAILCGGFARRLHPLTENSPKSLVEIRGTPFLGWQLRLLRDHGISRVVLCLGHHSEMIKKFVASEDFGMEVLFSEDGTVPLGTGGAIQKAIPLLGEQFMVLNGDSYLEIDYREVCAAFTRNGKKCLMTIFKNKDNLEKSNVEFRDGAIRNYNKNAPSQEMEYIDFGLSVFSSSAFDFAAASTEFDLARVYERLLAFDQLSSFESPKRFFEIGSHQGLKETADHFERMNKNVY